MPTRIAIKTHYPARMKKGGEKTYFTNKIMKYMWLNYPKESQEFILNLSQSEMDLFDKIQPFELLSVHEMQLLHPKSQTIRENYEFYKKLEGKLIQPYIWAGRPYHSKQIVFCPPVLLNEVRRLKIKSTELFDSPNEPPAHVIREVLIDDVVLKSHEFKRFTQADGFDSVDDFFDWFDKDWEGALLKFGV